MSFSEALERLRAGRAQAAADELELLLHAEKDNAHYWFLLGACRHQLKNLPAAASALERAIALDSSLLEPRLAFLAVLRESQRYYDALRFAAEAQRRFPDNPRLLCASALVLEDLGHLHDALANYDRALAAQPDFEDALHNRGLLLLRLARHEEAEATQRAYVRWHPESYRARDVLVDTLLALFKFDDALHVLNDLAQISPDDAAILVRRGIALSGLHRLDDANRTFAAAIAKNREAVVAYVASREPGTDFAAMVSPVNLFLWQSWLAMGRCDWSTWTLATHDLRHLPRMDAPVVAPAVAHVAFHLPLDGRQRTAIARIIAAEIEEKFPRLPLPPRRRSGPIRVGILSPDFREHLNAHLLLPLFEMLDRRQFELHAYSLLPDDDSTIRSRLVQSADCFKDLAGTSTTDAACVIRDDDIDILVDAAGHTTGGRFAITAQQPARIQALYLGFAGSLGSSRVDFVVSDRTVGCDADEWTETPIQLPHTYFLYDFRDSPPVTVVLRKEYGLPEEDFVFCAFHKAEKISPDAFDLWMRVLTEVPSSVLWLLSLSGVAQRNLKREAEACSVDPARLVFAPFDPRDRYLARQRLGDLMLDAIHHSAMTTACDAMAAGLPVLTIPGNAMASRAGESLARAAGVPELVACDKDDYVKRAVFLARNPQELQRIRQKLLARNGPLFDTAGRVRELEQAFLKMWRRYEQRH